MTLLPGIGRGVSACTVLALAVAVTPVKGEATLLAQEARGAVELAGERILVVKGVRGEVVLRASEGELLRFASSSRVAGGGEPIVALWSEESTLVLRPRDGGPPAPGILWIEVPDGLAVEIEIEDSSVVATGLGGGLDVRGRTVELRATQMTSDIVVRLEGGSVNLQGSGGSVTVEAREADVRVLRPGGAVDLHLDESTLEIRDVGATVRVEADGGSVEIQDARGGADVRLRGASLCLRNSDGAVRIETDSDVTLEDNRAEIRLESWGGRIDGKRFEGALDLKLEGGEAKLGALGSILRLEANDARVDAVDLDGKLDALTRGGRLAITNARGPLKIEAEGGAVVVADALAAIEIRARNADIEVSGAEGPVQVNSDSAAVVVEWASMPSEGDSKIVNEGGDVTVRIPAGRGCWFTGRSRSGWIESEHPEVRISDDRSQASGAIGRRRRPTVDVQAEGSLYVLGGRSER